MKRGQICDDCGLKCTEKQRTNLGKKQKPQYADPCIGVLPGVLYACCGHGTRDGYIFFENGVTVRFEEFVEVTEAKVSRFHSFNNQTNKPEREL